MQHEYPLYSKCRTCIRNMRTYEPMLQDRKCCVREEHKSLNQEQTKNTITYHICMNATLVLIENAEVLALLSLNDEASVEVHTVVWTSLGPQPRWVPGPTTRWAPGTTRLALHGTCWREAQGLQRRSTRIASCTCPAMYRGLLDVLD
jgi:hypothetical protein